MLTFNTTMHDFGDVKKGAVASTSFTYTGDEPLQSSDFEPSCQCTAGVYNSTNKQFTVGMKTDSIGSKQVNIKVKENTYLILKINVIPNED